MGFLRYSKFISKYYEIFILHITLVFHVKYDFFFFMAGKATPTARGPKLITES